MLHLATIFHMHQPYYKDLLTQEIELPWVRLHGVKDYLDMVEILGQYPKVKQTFNIVPSLIEQVEDYVNQSVKERYLELTIKPAEELSQEEKRFILNNFFSINKTTVISVFPRYLELYFKKQAGKEFATQDLLDLQLLFNLAWVDPSFRQNMPELASLTAKGRFFNQEDKLIVVEKQKEILSRIIPAYRKYLESGQVEFIVSPYYHPILPLLYSTNTAKEAEPKTLLPRVKFSYPQDAQEQIKEAINFFRQRLGHEPGGMWPSEESVCEHILPFFIQAGIKWIVTDEALLFKSLKSKRREGRLLYQPYEAKTKEGSLNIIFRDRNLSDLIGFVYNKMTAKGAVDDFIGHLEGIARAFSKEDTLVTIALDGENVWEYFLNDGRDFLNLLYQRLSEAEFLCCTTVEEYLKTHPAKKQIKRLAAGSWIYGNFGKWIGCPTKVRGWEYLAQARKTLEDMKSSGENIPKLAWKQIYILEGSDWYWWLGEDPDASFDCLFRTHLCNFYRIINKEIPEYLNKPI